MQSESRESLLNKNLKVIVVLLVSSIIIFLILFRNLFFEANYILKSFGELSVDPEIAFTNNKPTFLEFYAEWCEVCKEMAPKISYLKKEYENDINFVFINVDNQKWEKYIRKFNVNGIPQVNLFDRKGNLIFTFVGKQEATKMRESIAQIEIKSQAQEENLNNEFSLIKENKNHKFTPRNHG